LSKGSRFVFVVTGAGPTWTSRPPELAARCLVVGYWVLDIGYFRKEVMSVGTYTLEMVIECWRTEQLTAEQAIGQILQFLQQQQKRQDELEAQLWEVKRAHRPE
jgi:hypothetical protein